MKTRLIILILLLLALCATLMGAKIVAEKAVERTLAQQTLPEPTAAPATLPPETTEATEAPTTVPTTAATEVPTETTEALPVRTFTAEEEELLLKIGMAERGDTYCTDCIALVMCPVLNRVDTPGKFGSTVKSVIYAEGQFTPVAEGKFEDVEPNYVCKNALDKVKSGWDESQGALYYEWGKVDGWHAQNLNFLFKHCDTKFYN